MLLRAAAAAKPAGTTRRQPVRCSASRTEDTARERPPQRCHLGRFTAANARRDAPTATASPVVAAAALYLGRASQRAGGSTPPIKSSSLQSLLVQEARLPGCSSCSAARQSPPATTVFRTAARRCLCRPGVHLCCMRRRADLRTRGCCAVHVLRTFGCEVGAAKSAATCRRSHRTSAWIQLAC
eukprot:SAG22_NODE_523_length_9482_cov_4.992548_8_plen_183_part_00